MPRRARIHYVSLRSSLVNLPISIYGPLLERGVRPQGLAVHLTQVTPGKQKNQTEDARTTGEAYLGWTGMVSASSLAQFHSGGTADGSLETVEIDPQLAQGLGFAENDIVEIGLLHDLSYAASVATEPLTADDWEILELHATHVESTMLSQVRVAVVGQEIDVWVLGRTRVRLLVVSVEPQAKGKALLLTTSTEVSIAPKTRATRANGSTSSLTNGQSNGATQGKGKSKTTEAATEEEVERRQKRTVTLRNLPTRILPSFSPTCPALEDGTILAVGFVSKSTLNLLTDQPRDATPRTWVAKVWRLTPPADPSAPSGSQNTLAPAVPRVLVPSEPNNKGSSVADEKKPNNEILVAWSPELPVPGRHISLHGSVAGIEDWDLVRVEFVRESDEVLAPLESDVTPVSQQGTDTRAKLAGVNDILEECKSFCITTYNVHAVTNRVNGVPGLLVTGRSGSGKTSILRAVAKSLMEDPSVYTYTLYVDLTKYVETPVSKIKTMIKYWFDKAWWHKPSVVILDNMDKLMSVELEHADSFRTRHITELFLLQFGSAERFAAPNARAMVLLASAESNAAIHPRLNKMHVFKEVIHLKSPGKDARRDILANIVQSHLGSSDMQEDPDAPLNFTALATQTEGYSATDLKDLVARAVHRAAIKVAKHAEVEGYQPLLTTEDFASAQVDFVPLSLRDVKLQKSDIAWADIGGLGETKQVLRETLEWPTKYGPIFAQSPLRLRSGLLLYGYPGCGKTLLASAVAKECGLNFISVKGPELLNKYIGASEQSVRELFERASAAKPCVLFFDEFDSIAPKRGHDSTGVTDRVVNQMLTQMDGAEGLEGVYVLAATSRPDLIDSALLRPGRLDKSLLCNMPDTQERKEILEAVSRKVVLAHDVDLEAVAQDTDGFSGADLQALVYNAQLEVIHEAIATAPVSSSAATNGGSRDAEEKPIVYTRIGGPKSDGKVKTRAEEAAFQSRLRRIFSSSAEEDTQGGKPASAESPLTREITNAHLRKVLSTTRPSVPPQERERLARMQVSHSYVRLRVLTASPADIARLFLTEAASSRIPRMQEALDIV